MWTAVATLVPSLVILLGVIFAILRWIGKVDRNTEATEALTKAFSAFSDRIGLRVDDHEVRIRVLESHHQDASKTRQNRS